MNKNIIHILMSLIIMLIKKSSSKILKDSNLMNTKVKIPSMKKQKLKKRTI